MLDSLGDANFLPLIGRETDSILAFAGAGLENQPQAICVHPAHLPVSQGSPAIPLLTQA